MFGVKKNRKLKLVGGVRNYAVENKYRNDIIWIIWDVILNEANKRNKAINNIVDALSDLFCVRYQPGSKRKRKFMIYFAISLLTETFDTKIPLLKNEEHIKAMNVILNKISLFKLMDKCFGLI